MPPPISEPTVPEGGAHRALQRPLLLFLTAVILIAPIIGQGGQGQFVTGVLSGGFAALVFWLGSGFLIKAAIAAKTGSGNAADATKMVVPESLAPVLARLETSRKEWASEIDQRLRTRLPLGLAVGVLLWAWGQFGNDAPGIVELAVYAATGVGIGWTWASYELAAHYRTLYKTEVLPRLAAQLGDLSYQRAVPIDVDRLNEQRLFERFDSAIAEDEITGTLRGAPVSIVEARLTRRSGNNTEIVFDGLLTRVTLPRSLSGTTAVIPDRGMLDGLRDVFGERAMTRVRIEDPAFEALYQVHGSNQVSARALLTPAFMARFLALGARTGLGQPVALAEDNHLTIARPKAGLGDLFEPPSYSRPADSRDALAKLHADIVAVLDVADAAVDLDYFSRGGS